MKILQELHTGIDFRKVNVLGKDRDDIDRLFRLIRSGEITDAAGIRAHFYPDSPHAVRYANRLQQQLRRRMINTVFCTDTHEKNYWEQYFETAKKALVCTFLWNNGKSAAAAEIAAEVAREAAYFHFPHIGLDICRQLAGHYSVVRRDPRKYRQYREQYDQFQEMDRRAQEAEMYYYELSLELRHLKAPDEAAVQKAVRYRDELAAVPQAAKSLQFVLVYTNIAVFACQLQNDLAGIISACESALAYFAGLPFTPPARALRSVYFNLVPAALQTEAYDKAGQYIGQVKALVAPGSHNWIGIHQYQTILAFRLNDLPPARTSIEAIKAGKHHQLIGEEVRIYEAYLTLLEGETPKLGKLLNETPHFSTDKKGMNINLLILQVLIFLRRDDRPAVIERLEALQAYAYRYLAKDPALRRSELFFRLLFLLARSAFDPAEVHQRAPGLLEELRRTPRHISAIDVEVVGYERLWEMVEGY